MEVWLLLLFEWDNDSWAGSMVSRVIICDFFRVLVIFCVRSMVCSSVLDLRFWEAEAQDVKIVYNDIT